MVVLAVSASGPMLALAGGIVTTFAVTGNIGTPLAFPIIAIVLGLFTVGLAAMSRHIYTTGIFYAYISRGLGGVWGTAAAFIALLSYITIQIALYGLFGAIAASFFATHTGLTWSWWAWALIATALVAVFGALRIRFNAKVLAVLLVVEVVMVILFDVAGLTHPSGDAPAFAGFNPHNLVTPGVGGVLAFTIVAFMGFETAGNYAEEVSSPFHRTGQAMVATVVVTGVLYTVSAWALSVGAGPRVVHEAQRSGSNIVFKIIGQHYGTTFMSMANVVLMTSVFAAVLSFHHTGARYLLSAGRDGVLPRHLARTSVVRGAPYVASNYQAVFAAALVFMLRADDPVRTFRIFGYLSAVGIVLLMGGTALACLVYLNAVGTASMWQKTIAPILSVILLALVEYFTLANASSVLGVEKGSTPSWVPAGTGVLVVGAMGAIWGVILRIVKAQTYAGIGGGGEEFGSIKIRYLVMDAAEVVFSPVQRAVGTLFARFLRPPILRRSLSEQPSLSDVSRVMHRFYNIIGPPPGWHPPNDRAGAPDVR